MRIISGKFKGKKLFHPPDEKTRPLKDLVKELDKNNFEEVKMNKKVHRPWGNFISVIKEKTWQVKRLEIRGPRISTTFLILLSVRIDVDLTIQSRLCNKDHIFFRSDAHHISL